MGKEMNWKSSWMGAIGAMGAVTFGMFAYMAQQRADKDLVDDILANDWKKAIGHARILARYRPHHWCNINLVIEQAAARAGHPVGKRGKRLAKLETKIPRHSRGYVKPADKEYTAEEAIGEMFEPIVIRDPLADRVWCVVESPFAGNRAGGWFPIFIRLLKAAQAVSNDPKDGKAHEEIMKISKQMGPSIERYNDIKELIKTDIQQAKSKAFKIFMDAFETGKERRRKLLRRNKRRDALWAD